MMPFLRFSTVAPLCVALISLSGCATAPSDVTRTAPQDPRCSVERPLLIPASAPTSDSPKTPQSSSAADQWNAAVQEAAIVAHQITSFTPSAEKTAEFRAQYGAWLHNPFNATALMSHLKAEQLYKFIAAVAPGSYGGTAWAHDHDTLLRDLGTMIALSTGGQNLSAEMSPIQATFDELRADESSAVGSLINSHIDSVLQAYGEQAQQEFAAPHISVSTPQHIVGHTLLTQAVGMAAASNPDLTLGAGFYIHGDSADSSLASNILTWDALLLQHRRAESTPRETAIANVDTRSPAIVSESDRTVTDPLHALYLASDAPLNASSNTVSQAIEATRLDALRTFLGGMTPFPVQGNEAPADLPPSVEWLKPSPMNTSRYLTGTRGQNTFSDLGFQDCGHAFGKMIFDAARTEPSPKVGPHEQPQTRDFPTYEAYRAALAQWNFQQRGRIDSVRVAAGFLEGYQDGLDRPHGIENTPLFLAKRGGVRLYGYHNPLLRSWAGSILAPHMKGIARSLITPIGGDASWTYAPKSNEPIIAFGELLLRRLRGPQSMFLDLQYDDPAPLGLTMAGDTSTLHFEGGRAPAIEVLRLGAEQSLAEDISNTPLTNQAIHRLSQVWRPLYAKLYFIPANSSENLSSLRDARIERTRYLDAEGISISIVPDPASFDPQSVLPNVQIMSLNKGIAREKKTSGSNSFTNIEAVASASTSRAYFIGVSRSKHFVIPQSWLDQKEPQRIRQIPVDSSGALIDYTQMTIEQRAFFEHELLNGLLTYDFGKPFILSDRQYCSMLYLSPRSC